MSSWRDRYSVVEKWTFFSGGDHDGTYYLILDKLNPGFSINMVKYLERRHACSAASNIFRAEQRKIEKILLG